MAPKYEGVDIPLAVTGAQPDEEAHTAASVAHGVLGPEAIQTRQVPLSEQESEPRQDFDIISWWRRVRHKDGPAHHTIGPRIVHLNDPVANRLLSYRANNISTTKYNIGTFLPKFLMEQFSKYANMFFLITAIIQQVPNVTPFNRYTTIGTLMVVLIVSAIKELTEDFKRRKSDRELNHSRVLRLQNGVFEECAWIDIAVGDIIKVESGDPFPADVILLASSEPEGLCYVETSNLDGETNLKIKQAHPDTGDLINPSALAELKGKLLSEHPNSSLYTYEGTLKLEMGSIKKNIPLTPNQMLLRGANLRNTRWVYGLVVFTGHETKLLRNATASPIKRTAIEHMLNKQIVILFIMLILLALISSLGNVITEVTSGKKLDYLYLDNVNYASVFFKNILTYWVLFSAMIPISLFVTLELVRYYQAYLISSDLDIYYEEQDIATVCRTSSLVEELGQVGFIFSDKTGTLTCNVMEFKACSIAGVCYMYDIPEDKRHHADDDMSTGAFKFSVLLDKLKADDNESKLLNDFLLHLASCHTVIPEVDEENPSKIKYQAASPDEGALVEGAAKLGYKFIGRTPKAIILENDGMEASIELLNVCEFNSTRKRMSTIFRFPDGRIRLFCKGADTVIFERLAENSPHVTATTKHLEEFAVEGLRTLCIAYRDIPEDEYQRWAAVYDEAATAMTDRQEKLEAAAELIEKDLCLLGATAIEDKLQDGVPDTIHNLQQAGIRIWVLTGDRQETAINIGMSCKLLAEDMNLLIVNEETREDTVSNIEQKLEAINSQNIGEADIDSLALVIDGVSLGFALERASEKKFLELACKCKAVICCRVSPLQKSLVVRLVKRHLTSILLAIGDGANDVSMIQAAHVGVGISGMEGTQAARSADIAIGQFRYLEKLLLVHGLWNYNRTSKVILYSFYKNVAINTTQFFFGFINVFSGQTMYESWTLTMFNVVFTILPPFALGVFDQFVSARLLVRYPQLYRLGQRNVFFNRAAFSGWILNGLYHGALIFGLSVAAYKGNLALGSGKAADLWVWGTAAYTAGILTVLSKAALITSTWTKITVVAIPGSFALWMLILPLYAWLAPLTGIAKIFEGILPQIYGSLTFWALTFLIPIMCLMRDIAWKYYHRMYLPSSYHFVQEIQKYNIADYRPRMQQFQKAIRKVRQVQRMRKQRGFAFSQVEEGQTQIVRAYDTTIARGLLGETADHDVAQTAKSGTADSESPYIF
ncbi:hypothetical protein CANCADRAFT_22881 [Tortispora caseinolytica NRRL Y-17796]|uniref:Phospholipid-transporting ATPase n=1 Tax=Tortispora caseinolytica NRRL Y-17796 TaxID=767744 RepID=A0A1E4TK42_9ASCO|nr:hypothetical protein CANCADRAFT_22881 [Tortispora caseinolytica NRRL Y-17796]